MKTEFEAKFLDVDFEEVRKELAENGAILKNPMRTMKRAIIDSPAMKQNNAFIRVRDEGDKISLTYKQFDNLSVDGAKEHEVVVDDFRETVDLLSASGLILRSFQESRRETWKLQTAEIVLDEWPWLKPYIEIEADSEDAVSEMSKRLGFIWGDAVFGDVMAAYRAQYPHLTIDDTIGTLSVVKFGDPIPELLKNSQQ